MGSSSIPSLTKRTQIVGSRNAAVVGHTRLYLKFGEVLSSNVGYVLPQDATGVRIYVSVDTADPSQIYRLKAVRNPSTYPGTDIASVDLPSGSRSASYEFSVNWSQGDEIGLYVVRSWGVGASSAFSNIVGALEVEY